MMTNEEFVEEILFHAHSIGKIEEVRELAEKMVKNGKKRSIAYADALHEISKHETR